MKISIKDRGMLVAIEVDSHPTKKQALKLFESMYDMYKDFVGDEDKVVACDDECKAASEPAVKPVQVARDDFNIRQRLPNNVVDIKELDIKQAVTQKALVRCPKCGQAHCLAVNSGQKVYLMERNFSTDDFNVIAEFDSLNSQDFADVCCTENTDRLAYFNDLQSAEVISRDDFAADNDTELFCPVCCSSNAFFYWKDAFETPLKYFETEHLCDVCGGEKIERFIKKKHVHQCDKCGHQTDYKEE